MGTKWKLSVRETPVPCRRNAMCAVLRLGVLAALTMAVSVAGTGQKPAEAAAAPRVTGVVIVNTPFSFLSSQSPKRVRALCPAGKQVVGGGAVIFGEDGDNTLRRVTLTQVEPHRSGTNGFAYSVTAAEVLPGTTDKWSLSASAVCADPVPGYDIVVEVSPSSSSPVRAISAPCPSGQRALGTGARINTPLNQSEHGIGLQVARVDGQGVQTRAQAHEHPAGYPHDWQLLAFAVCADSPQGFEVRTAESEARDAEVRKHAQVTCSGGKRLLSAGAAISNVAPGDASLNLIGGQAVGAVVVAFWNTPTPPQDWDFIIARIICVDD